MKILTNDFMSLLELVGIIDTLILVIILVRAFILWLRGISPVLIRLGNGLARRKIAIFAKGDNLISLQNLLLDSKLFREKNICSITAINDLGRAEQASVYLVFWHDWIDEIQKILDAKPDSCALVVYAPYYLERISTEHMQNLDGKRHSAVSNFRGRLLNDIVTSLITTSYESK